MSKTKAFFCSPLAIAVAAFVIRAVYLSHVLHQQPHPSNGVYFPLYEVVCVAKSVAEGNGFSSPLLAPSGPTAMVTPVYTYALALIFRFFGILSLQSSVAIRVLDILVSALACFPLIAIGRRLFGTGTAAIAGWIWAWLPNAIFYSVVWIWDTSFSAFVLTLALWLTYLAAERYEKKYWAWLGLIWGVGTLVISALLSVFPGCLAFATYRAKRQGVPWIRRVSLTLLVFCATLSPWIVRNAVAFHGRVFLRSNFGLELWLGNNPAVPISCACWLHPSHDKNESRLFFQLGEVGYMREKQREAITFIKSDPAAMARRTYHRFMETWTGFGDPFADIWATRVTMLRASLLLNYSLTILALLGLVLARRAIAQLSWPLLNLIVVFPIVYYVCHTDPRYRQPIDPIIALLCAFAVVRLYVTASSRFFPHKLTENSRIESTR